MELKISAELQAKLDRIAEQQGRDTHSLVRETVERFVNYDEWFVREVEKGLAEIDSGAVMDEEEVSARIEKLIRQKQRRTCSTAC
jgi:predicted transcriptional regulator